MKEHQGNCIALKEHVCRKPVIYIRQGVLGQEMGMVSTRKALLFVSGRVREDVC